MPLSDAIPSPDIFVGNPARHAELDRLVNRNMTFLHKAGIKDDDSYVCLLVTIVEHSDNALDGTYSDHDDVAIKLQEDSRLKDELRDALESKSYRKIRNLGKWYPRSSSVN